MMLKELELLVKETSHAEIYNPDTDLMETNSNLYQYDITVF